MKTLIAMFIKFCVGFGVVYGCFYNNPMAIKAVMGYLIIMSLFLSFGCLLALITFFFFITEDTKFIIRCIEKNQFKEKLFKVWAKLSTMISLILIIILFSFAHYWTAGLYLVVVIMGLFVILTYDYIYNEVEKVKRL